MAYQQTRAPTRFASKSQSPTRCVCGNGGQQFVGVEPVHVNDGGQAVIGNVKMEAAKA
jgi:hypothetical protein